MTRPLKWSIQWPAGRSDQPSKGPSTGASKGRPTRRRDRGPLARLVRRPITRLAERLSSRSLLVTGLSSIVICVLLVADLLGLVPDRNAAVREGRLALSESVALTAAMLSAGGDAPGLARYLERVVQRQGDVIGARVRSADGGFVAEAGQPAPLDTTVAASSDTRVVVPMLSAGSVWGHAELHFKPVSALAQWMPLVPQAAPLALFLGVLCLALFHLYMRRMLRHLDPSNTIPARVQTAFDTMADGVMVLSPKGEILMFNKAFAQVTGVEHTLLLGLDASYLPWSRRDDGSPAAPGAGPDPAPTGPAPRHLRDLPWQRCQASGQMLTDEVLLLPDAQGRHRTFMVNCSPIPGAGQRPSGVLVSLDDVTELEEKEVQLRQARDAAQAANRAKSEFLANMSHEIRTPMNAILGFTELLRRGRVSNAADAQKHLDTIHSSGKHLLELINDILDLSKVEAGHLDVQRVPCAAHEVALDVARIMAVRAEEKGIALQLTFASRLPAHIHSDPARLRQVLTNLVGNAIKFTARGEVRVTLGLADGPGSQRLHITVADSGIGIPAHRLDAIFEPFVQAESSTTRQFGGTGLGLTISRRFARALGGDITVSSQPGQGSVFRLTLDTGPIDGGPWLEPPALQALQSQGQQPSGATADTGMSWRFPPRQVLVVDDGNENRELVRLVLQDVGLQVVEAENGARALEALARHRPDLVLMDIQMPVMDGHTATRRLREQGHTLPVLALTANAMKGFEHDLMATGFSGYLTKPIDIDELLGTLAPMLGGQRCPAPAAAPDLPVLHQVVVNPVKSPGPNPGAVPPQQAARPAGPGEPIPSRLGGHPRLARVARSFCLQLPPKLQDMRDALTDGHLDELAALAHWLKGAGGSVGYDVLTDPARTLEQQAKADDRAGAAATLQALSALALRLLPPPDGDLAPSAHGAHALAPTPSSAPAATQAGAVHAGLSPAQA